MDPILITVAFICGYILFRVGLPPLVGFLLAGLGLNFFGYTASPMLTTMADIGVTLLLFTIGLKLNIKSLFKPEIWATATIHMGITVGVFGGLLFLLAHLGIHFFIGLSVQTALLIAFGLSFSSTVFAVKVLEESGRMDSLNGRVAIGVLIIQDIVAVLYLTVSTGKVPSIWAVLLIALLPLLRKLCMLIMDKLGHGELQTLFGLFLALTAGYTAFEMVGLKGDLGALIIGVLIGQHPKAKELANALLNFKDLLLVGFFVDIGLTGLPNTSGLIASIILVFFIPIKLLFYFILFSRFKLKAKTSFNTTINLGNYSEFGLIVCAMAASSGHLEREWLVVMAIALSLSLILASSLYKYNDALFSIMKPFLKRFETEKRLPEELPYTPGAWEIVIVGMGRVGEGAYDFFHKQYGDVIIGVDYDLENVQEQRNQNRRVIHGDVTDEDYYQRLPKKQKKLKLVILAMPNVESKIYVAKILKERNIAVSIAAIAQFDDEVEALQKAGVDTAFNMYDEAGAGLAAHICANIDGLQDQITKKDLS